MIHLVLAVTLLMQRGLQPPLTTHPEPLRALVVLRLQADRSEYLPTEAIRLTAEIENVTDDSVTGIFALSPRLTNTEVQMRVHGGEFEALRLLSERHISVPGRRTLAPHEKMAYQFVISVSDSTAEVSRAVLAGVGNYELRVLYSDTGSDPNGRLESNVLQLAVVPPPPVEQEAATAYTAELAYVTQLSWGEGFISLENQEAAENFARRFPNSRYTPPLRQGLKNWLDYRIRIHAANAEEKARFDRLSTNDAVGPSLALSATPSTLWPPNKKMSLVTVNVVSADDSGTAPSIKLSSITCDDGCNAQADITGAAFGTDDRVFNLRANRTGSGGGRTYTITYEAADAAGNKATATTTVVVPHDQGKK